MMRSKKMRSKNKILEVFPSALAATLIATCGLSGCRRAATDDASLTQAVQSKLSSDTALASEPIQATVLQGVATLSGTVGSEAARALASNDVAQVQGIKTVVNDLKVTLPGAHSVASVSSAQRSGGSRATKPTSVHEPGAKPDAEVQHSPTESHPVQPAPIERTDREAPTGQVPPPPSMIHNVSVPSGTTLAVRLNQTLDSASTQSGESFSGTLASDILVDGSVVLPQGTPVSGRVNAVQEAAHFKGSSLLTIELTSIDRKEERLAIATDSFSKAGSGRGKNSAEKIGGGAAVGAILGGIFGGGKGAAIGAAAGGGAGAGVQGITKGEQVQIPAESLVRFHLSNAITVRVGPLNHSGNEEGDLQRH